MSDGRGIFNVSLIEEKQGDKRKIIKNDCNLSVGETGFFRIKLGDLMGPWRAPL
jgi:hypothetical protein